MIQNMICQTEKRPCIIEYKEGLEAEGTFYKVYQEKNGKLVALVEIFGRLITEPIHRIKFTDCPNEGFVELMNKVFGVDKK